MSPAGSFESLSAAINAGAGSVYFGVGNMNMRAQSSVNFTIDDIKTIIDKCNKAGVKSYLTANTVVYNEELENIFKVIDVAAENNVSAVIASDMAIIQYCRDLNIEVHISTQLNICNTHSLKFYSGFADVIVLARELNLNQIREISDYIKKNKIKGPKGKLVRLEMFVHGALCMAISGKCYLSLHEYNKSANKGRCLQVCRRAYEVEDKETSRQLEVENEYIMSPKDLSTIHFINKILDSGVSVLKIEGRARSAEYVKTVTECYHEAVDSVFNEDYDKDKIKKWQTRLSTVFNRGFWDGYYLGQKLGEWSHIYGSMATTKKEYVGIVTNYFSNISVAEIDMKSGRLGLNDKIIITGPTTGVVEMFVSELRVNLKETQYAAKGQKLSVKVPGLVRRSDKVYKVVNLEKHDLMAKG